MDNTKIRALLNDRINNKLTYRDLQLKYKVAPNTIKIYETVYKNIDKAFGKNDIECETINNSLLETTNVTVNEPMNFDYLEDIKIMKKTLEDIEERLKNTNFFVNKLETRLEKLEEKLNTKLDKLKNDLYLKILDIDNDLIKKKNKYSSSETDEDNEDY